MKFSIIAAVHSPTFGIGRDNSLAWYIHEDMKHFHNTTRTVSYENKQNAVIMGRKTWDSIKTAHKPLTNRFNIVLSRTLSQNDFPSNVVVCDTFEEALSICESRNDLEKVFVIGGESVYNKAIIHHDCETLHITKVVSLETKNEEVKYESFFPTYEYLFNLIQRDTRKRTNEYEYTFQVWKRKSDIQKCLTHTWSECDDNYFKMIRNVFENGRLRSNRTNTKTISIFRDGYTFNLQNNSVPMLATKKVDWNIVVSELLWFLRGQTDAQLLIDQNVNIWTANGRRKVLDSVGLTNNREYDLGKIYGFQWRHFGAEYKDCDTDYTGQGVDQIRNIVNTIRTNPTCRRIVLTSWNPKDMNELALPPCHMFCQFYVHVETKELSCCMYQRSCDVGLGVPYNIASYSLLTHIIAKLCNLTAKEFHYDMGDVHIYENHINALQSQLRRSPPMNSRPTLELMANNWNTIDDVQKEDIVLHNYNPLPVIKMKMAV